MCREEGVNLQRGMNFGSSGRPSIILMSRWPGAPYDDRVEEDGRVLIYEGHDRPQIRGGPDPKTLDQPERGPGGTLTQNGLFLQAASQHRKPRTPAERIRVYEKMRTGIWTFNGASLRVRPTCVWSRRRCAGTRHRIRSGSRRGHRRAPGAAEVTRWPGLPRCCKRWRSARAGSPGTCQASRSHRWPGRLGSTSRTAWPRWWLPSMCSCTPSVSE